ncbi:toxin VasX [Vreelandella olivaria]|uniref:toxin VasX n=1 Tax=Vreelandella olivaria TaxID=390919 RepID=UPI00201F4556|nr:toxin VasX [Halomonas olivaria]
MSATQCPLLAAIIPVRYAIGHQGLESPCLEGVPLPELQGTLVTLDDSGVDSLPLRYVARPLRDGWCYVWLENQQRLIEYQVTGGALQETSRAGAPIMPGGGAYLFLPCGQTAAIAWSPVPWSDEHYRALQTDGEQRHLLMREFIPAQAPHSGPLEWAVEIPELNAVEENAFAWSSEPQVSLPRWESMMPTLTQAEVQAVAIVDDPWGVVMELAHLQRQGLARREAWFAQEGEERTLAQNILALVKQNREVWAKLPHLADQPRIEEAAKRYDADIEALEARLATLVDDWQRWMETFWQESSPATLAAAQSHFDPSRNDDHDAMETLWSAALLGATHSQGGALLVERMLDPAHGPTFTYSGHSLWVALLGVMKHLQLSDVQRMLTLPDSLPAPDWETWAHSVNQLSVQLGSGLMAAREGLFLAVGTTIGPLLKEAGAASLQQTLVAGYFAAALARSSQTLTAEAVSIRQVADWLNEPSARVAGAPATLSSLRPELFQQLENRQMTVLRLAANEATTPVPPSGLFSRALTEAPLKSVLVLLNGAMLVNAGITLARGDRSIDTGISIGSGLFGTATATAAIFQHFAQVDAQDLRLSQGMSTVWRSEFDKFLTSGQITSGALGITALFDVIYFGRLAWERYGQGDLDSATIATGMSAASAGQSALAARAFIHYRRAQAALRTGQLVQAANVASRAGKPGLMLGLTLLIIAGAVSLYYTRENPLEQWLRNTRFGTHPAAWAGDLEQELDALYRLLYQPRLRLERKRVWNHRLTTQHTAVWLYVEFPAAERFPGMFTLEATERWRAGWWGSERRSALLTEQDFELDIGGRHRRPVYRKVYHATPEDETLISLSGTLHYRPFPELTLSPIALEIS